MLFVLFTYPEIAKVRFLEEKVNFAAAKVNFAISKS